MSISIDLEKQRLSLWRKGRCLFEAPISSAFRGAGEEEGSLCTPRGWHVIHAKFGEGCPPDTVFIARRPAERYTPALASRHPQRDFILARILWLSGLEQGKNRGQGVDTLRRFIYIHGCPPDTPLGIPLSHGCIRMHPHPLMVLFASVEVGTKVLIR